MIIKRLLKFLGPAIWLIFTALSFTHDNLVALAQQGIDKLDSSLVNQLTKQGRTDYIVRFSAQADLSSAYSMDWDARGEFVYNTLAQTAKDSQAKAKTILNGNGSKYQTFIAGNELYIWEGDFTLANKLATLPEVYFIRPTKTYHIDPVVVDTRFMDITWAGDLLAKHLLTNVGNAAATSTNWGIVDTHADQFWTTFATQGDGIVVANIDTGVQWNHPALDQAFKCGANPTDPSCWFDPSNICSGSACDNNGHGTHTMGTMVADDDPTLSYIAGMAPSAHWIACKGCESTDCSEFAINSCADWILAPNGNPSNRPNVINNSWGGSGGDNWFLAKVEAWRAAGIFPAFSAGNDGEYGCNTLGSPGDYQESFGSAAHDSGGFIANFSSRGPSAFGHEPYTKPNLSAPGVGIISSFPTNGWASISGTSMASPHTAGAVALLFSCNPSLVGQIDATFQLLQNNTGASPAGTCGVPPDGQGNYTYGYGYLDVLNAGLMTCSNIFTGTLEGHVYDDVANPIAGAAITAVPINGSRQFQTSTDLAGAYTMTLLTGGYDVTASKDYYLSKTITDVVIITNTVTTQDIDLTFLGGWNQLSLPTSCPNWYSYDGEYFSGAGRVYFLGGHTITGTDGSIYSYNPANHSCTSTGKSMPIPISDYKIALINNGSTDLLCAFGGLKNDGTSSTAVQCYNPISNSVATVSTLPGNLGGFIPGGVEAVNNKVYVFGGIHLGSAPYLSVQTWEWNPITNLWQQQDDLTLGRGFIDTAVVDGKIYAFGGEFTINGVNLVSQTIAEVFDPATGQWNNTAVADLPAATSGGTGYGFNSDSHHDLAGMIVIAGGGQFPTGTSEALLYNVGTNSYEYGFPDLNVLRYNQAGFFIPGNPGTLWVFGGRTGVNPSPLAPPEYYNVNLNPQSNIAITAPSLNTTLMTDETRTISFTISNLGSMGLDWILTEASGLNNTVRDTLFKPVDIKEETPEMQLPALSRDYGNELASLHAEPPVAALWDQPLSSVNQNRYQDQEFPNAQTYSSYLADDFTNPVVWSINRIFIPGNLGNGGTSLLNATSLTWQLYFDASALPDGDPAGGGIAPIWSLTLPPNDPQVSITPGSGGLDSNTTLTLESALVIPPGTYWLVFYPTMDSGSYGEYGRQPADTANGSKAKFINPGGGMGFGTSWSDWTVLGVVQTDIAYRLEGTAANNVPWMSVAPVLGTLAPGDTQQVALTFNSTGLVPNIYRASLILRNNDPDHPVVLLPVRLTSTNGEYYLPMVYKLR